MEKGKLIFVDEKECGQVCSTIILAHCQKGKKDEPSISIGGTIIQKKETSYKIELCDLKDVLGHLKMLTPSELAINARELMMMMPYIKKIDEKSSSEESSDIENIFSVNGLIFRNFDIHQGSIVFINKGKLDIKNLKYDVDKLEIRRLQREAFDRFEVQAVLYGDMVRFPNEEASFDDIGIYPFIYMYIPYFLAKTLKERFEETCVEVDVIGMISLTENYICFKREESRFGSHSEFIGFLYDKIGGSALKVEKDKVTDSHIEHYLRDREKVYRKLKEYASVPPKSACPVSFSRVVFEERFDFGIKPIALWLV